MEELEQRLNDVCLQKQAEISLRDEIAESKVGLIKTKLREKEMEVKTMQGRLREEKEAGVDLSERVRQEGKRNNATLMAGHAEQMEKQVWGGRGFIVW
jgi:hypothetical protein